MKMKRLFVVLLLSMAMVFSMDAFAGFSSGARSSVSSPSRSYSAPARTYSSPAPAPTRVSAPVSAPKSFSSPPAASKPSPSATASSPTPTASSPSTPSAASSKPSMTVNRASSAPKATKADVAAYKEAASSGKAFKTKAEATQTFTKNIDKECPSKFTAEPSVRPTYIPQSYSCPSGQNVTINYNRSYGGYGYMDPLTNAFVLFSAASMLSASDHERIMMQHGYYVGDPPVYHSSIVSQIFVGCIVLLVFGIVVVVLFGKRFA